MTSVIWFPPCVCISPWPTACGSSKVGVKGGRVVGKTDDFGFGIVEDKVHVHDLQATVLHCPGLEHTRLTYHYLGRDFRLTDVAGEVVGKLVA